MIIPKTLTLQYIRFKSTITVYFILLKLVAETKEIKVTKIYNISNDEWVRCIMFPIYLYLNSRWKNIKIIFNFLFYIN